MTYFALIKNNTLIGIQTLPVLDEDVVTIETTEEIYNNYTEKGNNYYIYQDGEIVLNPNYEQEEAAKRQAEFEKEFFETSLGYIRRSVNMANGSKKDFLSDLLPTIAIGITAGQTVNVIAYDEPPFDKDIEDWSPYQHVKAVTQQFIQECFQQLSNDFLPINEE